MAKKNKKTETETTATLTPSEIQELIEEDLMSPEPTQETPDAEAEEAPTPPVEEVPETPKVDEAPSAPKKRGRPRKEGAEPKARRDGPPHLAKVDRAQSLLAPLSEPAQLMFDDATASLSTGDLSLLIEHLQVAHRRRSVLEAGEAPALTVGDQVTVNSGRFAGQSAVVTKVQRIRAYAQVEGRNKPDYFFVSELSPVNQITAVEVNESPEEENLAATGS